MFIGDQQKTWPNIKTLLSHQTLKAFNNNNNQGKSSLKAKQIINVKCNGRYYLRFG